VSLILIAVAYGFVVHYAGDDTHEFSSQWTNSFVQFQFFSAGTLLALYLKGRIPKWNPAFRLAGIAVAIACWLIASVAFGVQADTPHSTVAQAPIGWALVLSGTVLLFLSLLGAPSRYLPAPIVYLGRISYGLYLFHELVYFLVFHTWRVWLTRFSGMLHIPQWRGGLGTILSFCLTVLAAHLSYKLYERPFLRLKRHFTFVPSRD